MNDNRLEELETDRRGEIRAVMSFVLALAILGGSVGVAIMLVMNKVKTEPVEFEKSAPAVVVRDLVVGDHVPEISSEGAVMSRREVRLAAELSGRVTSVSKSLVEGGRVTEGDVLAVLEDADFLAAFARAESSLADAELTVALEEAKGEQAKKDWAKLGKGKAPPLVLRGPQIKSAQKREDSAFKEVKRADRDVKRTKIKAPFSGRVREAGVEEGAVVMPGSMVAEIYSDEHLEVRLPFSLEDFGFIQAEGTPAFTVSADIGGEVKAWPAELVRVEGEVDRATLSGHAIAKILPDESGMLPPVGLFVRATMKGRPLEDVVEIPRAALRGGNVVWVVKDRQLKRRTVDVLRSTRESLVVAGDFESGETLVMTRLSAPIDQMSVDPKNADGTNREEPGNP